MNLTASMDLTPRAFLSSLELHGVKLGLDNIAHLLDRAGQPHEQFPSVHVAGTNGKGSVVAMLDAMLMASGYRTGRFTSPHLVDLSERFLLNAKAVDEAELDGHIGFYQYAAARMDPPPTYFELVTAVAFRIFATRQVDCALVEVGMGGRFDATNVLSPLATAVTNIDLDHQKYLGDTLEAIAFEKAGIIKPDIPVVIGEEAAGPQRVLRERAREVNAPARVVGRDYQFSISDGGLHRMFSYESAAFRLEAVRLGLAGVYQGENAATSVALAEMLQPHFPRLNESAVRKGLENARWPCRLERVMDTPAVYIDVAHNTSGAQHLARELPASVIVLAVSSDKNAEEMIDALGPAAHQLILTQFTGPRALPVDRLCEAARNWPYLWEPHFDMAILQGLRLAGTQYPLLISGSIFCAGEARRLLVEQHHALPIRFA
ncbi:MAG: bifunctional folylpolyglutamate synthase/dihydrofolate synthase [Candidatus Hydrogenedentota bacterium]